MADMNHGSGDLSLKILITRLWASKFGIVGVGILMASISLLITFQLPNVYSSQGVMVPSPDEKQSALGGLEGRFGDLASFAGISVGEDGVDKTTLALEILHSKVFLVGFVKKHGLVVPLMSAKGWNSEEKKWIINSKIYDEEKGKWVRNVDPPKKKEPSDTEIFERALDMISTNHDKKTKIVKIKVSTFSAEHSAEWASLLIEDLNNYIREQDVSEAKKTIAYLKKQLNATQVSDFQMTFNKMIESHMKTIMLAEIRDGYVFKVIDPPSIAEKKDSPRRGLIAAVALVFGMFLASFVVFSRSTLQA